MPRQRRSPLETITEVSDADQVTGEITSWPKPVAIGVGFARNALDEHFRLTENLKSMLAAAKDIEQIAQAAQAKVQQAGANLLDRGYDGLCAFLGRIVRGAEDAASDLIWRKINDLRWYLLPQL